MNSFHTIRLELGAGTIAWLIRDATWIAKQTNLIVKFTFNGVEVTLNGDTKPEDAQLVINAVKDGRERISISR